MELSSVLRKVRALVEIAERDTTPPHEAALARKTADDLMAKYAIEEWQAMAKAPKSVKPTRIKVDIGKHESEFLTETATLCNIIANFCNCSSVWMMGSGWGQRDEYCYVYGYESDLRYFELLFTTLYLHMVGAIFPSPDVTKTTGENAYAMRNAGLNWIEIAKAYGWREVPRREGEPKNVYVNDSRPGMADQRVGWSLAVGQYERAYRKVIKAKGEKIVRIPPNGARTYRINAAQGYLSRISQRLRMIKSQRGTGTEIMLRDKSQNIAAMIMDEHPSMQSNSARSVTYNEAAYARGTQHANTASLNPEAGKGSAPAVGA